MNATVIDGKRIAEQTREHVGQAAREFREKTGIVAHLAAVLVGNDPASEVYVRNKEKACEKAACEIEEQSDGIWHLSWHHDGLFCGVESISRPLSFQPRNPPSMEITLV